MSKDNSEDDNSWRFDHEKFKAMIEGDFCPNCDEPIIRSKP